MVDRIKKAIVTACKNSYGNEDTVINMDPETGVFEVYLRKTVVEDVEEPGKEILLEKAREIDPTATAGIRSAYTSIQRSLDALPRRPRATSSARASATASAAR